MTLIAYVFPKIQTAKEVVKQTNLSFQKKLKVRDDKYSLHSRNNLPQPIQMQLYKKQKLSPNDYWHF